jgi:hypothetical protein
MSRKKTELNTKQILRRVGMIIGSDENARIAEALGVAAQVCTNWKTRNTIPWAELFEFCQRVDISLDWLITGREKSGAFGATWPEHVKVACEELSELLLSGDASIRESTIAGMNIIKAMKEMKERGMASKVKLKKKKRPPNNPTSHKQTKGDDHNSVDTSFPTA